MTLSECFEMLKNGNRAFVRADLHFYFDCCVSIENAQKKYWDYKECRTIEAFYGLVSEVARGADEEDKNFFINALSKDCDWEFENGKAKTSWRDYLTGKRITAEFKVTIKQMER